MKSWQDYRVLLPVANPEHVEHLASRAAVLAGANDGQVLSLHVQSDLAKSHLPALLCAGCDKMKEAIACYTTVHQALNRN